MKAIFILIALTSFANAQGLPPQPDCPADSVYSSLGNGTYRCLKVSGHTAPIEGSGVTVTYTPAPTCEENWQLVLSSSGRPVCARELKEPKR